MRKLGITAALTAAVAAMLVAGTALGSTAAKRVVFKGSYAGTATSKVTGNVVDIAASGKGTGTLVGKSTLSGKGKGDATGQPACVPFTGPGLIAGKAKAKIKGKVVLQAATIKFTVLPTSTGCAGEDQNAVTVTGKAKVLGGVGVFKKAKGILRFTGFYNRGSGAFTVKFTGALTL